MRDQQLMDNYSGKYPVYPRTGTLLRKLIPWKGEISLSRQTIGALHGSMRRWTVVSPTWFRDTRINPDEILDSEHPPARHSWIEGNTLS